MALPRAGEVWQALANAADALSAVAKAMAGGDVSSPVPLSPLPSFADAPSLAQCVNELLKAKARAGRTDLYLRNLRLPLKRFVQSMQNRPAWSVTGRDVERWLEAIDAGPKTRKHHLDSVRLLFNHAKRLGWVRDNPALAVELPRVSAPAPMIHSPEEVRKVLAAMRRADADVCRFLAVRYFAGLRGSEAQALKPENIQLERGFIEVPALAAKTRRRRLVTLQPNLRAWLELGGRLPVADLQTRMARVARVSGVRWCPNVTRHSFCSYHLAKFQSAAKTALEAGHSEAMLFGHYRELVTPEQAEDYFSIRP